MNNENVESFFEAIDNSVAALARRVHQLELRHANHAPIPVTDVMEEVRSVREDARSHLAEVIRMEDRLRKRVASANSRVRSLRADVARLQAHIRAALPLRPIEEDPGRCPHCGNSIDSED